MNLHEPVSSSDADSYVLPPIQLSLKQLSRTVLIRLSSHTQKTPGRPQTPAYKPSMSIGLWEAEKADTVSL